MDGPMLTTYTAYGVLLSKEMSFRVSMTAPALKILVVRVF